MIDSLDELRNNSVDVECNKEILVRAKQWNFSLSYVMSAAP
jgi:hypothetical protein